MANEAVMAVEDIEANCDIPVFEVSDALDWMEGPCILGDNSMESLLRFADAVEAKALLVQYDFPDLTEYYIDPDDFDMEELFGDDIPEIMQEIEKRNLEIQKLVEGYDGRAWACSVFVMYQGQPFGIFLTDDDLIDSFGETSMEFMGRLYWDDQPEE